MEKIFEEAMYRALLDLGDRIHKLPSLYENWKKQIRKKPSK